ncbi:branched-chain amino acid ABC transporter permease [Thermodesulfobacteriota bacterium]
MDYFLQMIVSGVMTGTVYSMMALAIVVVYKASGIFNFAHGSLVAFTAFLLWQLVVPWNTPLVMAVPLYLIVISLLAFLLQRLILQPFIGQSLFAALMVTIALSDVFVGITVMFWPGPGRVFPDVIPSTTFQLGPAIISFQSLIIFAVCIFCFGAFFLFFKKTKLGLQMRGTAEDQVLAQSEGIRVQLIFAASWIIAIILAAVGGTLMSSLYGVSLEPLHGLGLKSLAVLILGGLESVHGSLVAGLIVGVCEALSAGYIDPYVGGGFGDVAPFIILITILIIRPHGLFGYERIRRV